MIMQKYKTLSKLTKQRQSRPCTKGNSKSLNVKTTNFTEGNELLEKSPTTARPTYAEILKAEKNPSIRTSKINLNNYKTNKHIHEKLYSLSPTIRTRKQGNISSRNNSNTNMAKDDKYQQEINELKEEIKLLKQSTKQQLDPKIELYRNNINSESKNENTASLSHAGQQENVEIITVINFIEQTMKTGLQSDPAGQLINITKKRFTKETVKQKLRLCFNSNKFQ